MAHRGRRGLLALEPAYPPAGDPRIIAVCLDFGDQATEVRDDAGTLLENDLIEGALVLIDAEKVTLRRGDAHVLRRRR